MLIVGSCGCHPANEGVGGRDSFGFPLGQVTAADVRAQEAAHLRYPGATLLTENCQDERDEGFFGGVRSANCGAEVASPDDLQKTYAWYVEWLRARGYVYRGRGGMAQSDLYPGFLFHNATTCREMITISFPKLDKAEPNGTSEGVTATIPPTTRSLIGFNYQIASTNGGLNCNDGRDTRTPDTFPPLPTTPTTR